MKGTSPSWRTAAVSLQHLDVLVASEERALQYLEAQLVRLGEDAIEMRLTAERLLSSLGRPRHLSPSVTSGAEFVRISAPSLPSVLRPHLRWIMRAIDLMREPGLLAWMLMLKVSNMTGSASPMCEIASLAEAAAALFDTLNPGDELRQRATIIALCELESLPRDPTPMAATPNFRRPRVEREPWPSPLVAALLTEYLCRLPTARRFLQRTLGDVLEGWLDEMNLHHLHIEHAHLHGSSMSHNDTQGKADGRGIRSRSSTNVAVDGEDLAAPKKEAEEEEEEEANTSPAMAMEYSSPVTAALPVSTEATVDALFTACDRLLEAATLHAPALPNVMLLLCSSVAASSEHHSPTDATSADCAEQPKPSGALLAAELLVGCWFAPAVGMPQAFGLNVLTANAESVQDKALHDLSAALGMASGRSSGCGCSTSGSGAPYGGRPVLTPYALVRLRERLELLGEAALKVARGGVFRTASAREVVPAWERHVAHIASLTVPQLTQLLALLRETPIADVRAAHTTYCAQVTSRSAPSPPLVFASVGSAIPSAQAALLGTARISQTSLSLLQLVQETLDIDALLGPSPGTTELSASHRQSVGQTDSSAANVSALGNSQSESPLGSAQPNPSAMQASAIGSASEEHVVSPGVPSALHVNAANIGAARLQLSSMCVLGSITGSLLKIPLHGDDDSDDEYSRVSAAVNADMPSGEESEDSASPRVLSPDRASVMVLCNLLRRLEPRGAESGALLPWLQAEHAIAAAMGGEGVAQQAQLGVVTQMLEPGILAARCSPAAAASPPELGSDAAASLAPSSAAVQASASSASASAAAAAPALEDGTAAATAAATAARPIPVPLHVDGPKPGSESDLLMEKTADEGDVPIPVAGMVESPGPPSALVRPDQVLLSEAIYVPTELVSNAEAPTIDSIRNLRPEERTEYEQALLGAVIDEIRFKRSVLLQRARKRELCSLAVAELTANKTRTTRHCGVLNAELNTRKLWKVVGSLEMRQPLAEFQLVQKGQEAQRIACAVNVLETLTILLASLPTLPKKESIDGLQRLLGRLAYVAARSATARNAQDVALLDACMRLRQSGPLPPPPSLGVPRAHERAVELIALIKRQLERLQHESTIEVKAALVTECWRLILLGTQEEPSPVRPRLMSWGEDPRTNLAALIGSAAFVTTSSSESSHAADFGMSPAAAMSAGPPLCAAAWAVDTVAQMTLDEEQLADLLPTAAWILINTASSTLLSDLQLILEMLPPNLFPVAPTAPLLLTAACMVRNLQPDSSSVSYPLGADNFNASTTLVADASVVHATGLAGSTDNNEADKSESVIAATPPLLGRVGVFAIRRLHAACMRRHALEHALAAQLTDVSARLRTAAALRHAAQLHSASLAASIGRLCAIRGPPNSLPISLTPTPPVREAAPLASPLHHEFVAELRREARHLVRAIQSAKLLTASAAQPEPRRLLHLIMYELFGDLAQLTDQVQFSSLLIALVPLHLAQLPSPPMPAGGVAPPPLQLRSEAAADATAFLQPHCLIAELTKGFLRHLPPARRFLELCLAAPLNDILYEAALDLSLPSSALPANGGQAPQQLIQALASTCGFMLQALIRHAGAVPRAAQMLANAVWHAALQRKLSEPTALALVGQLLFGCWLSPAVAAPQAYGVFPEPSPHERTCSNLDAVARELARLPAALHAGHSGANVSMLVEWLQGVLLLASTNEETAAAATAVPETTANSQSAPGAPLASLFTTHPPASTRDRSPKAMPGNGGEEDAVTARQWEMELDDSRLEDAAVEGVLLTGRHVGTESLCVRHVLPKISQSLMYPSNLPTAAVLPPPFMENHDEADARPGPAQLIGSSIIAEESNVPPLPQHELCCLSVSTLCWLHGFVERSAGKWLEESPTDTGEASSLVHEIPSSRFGSSNKDAEHSLGSIPRTPSVQFTSSLFHDETNWSDAPAAIDSLPIAILLRALKPQVEQWRAQEAKRDFTSSKGRGSNLEANGRTESGGPGGAVSGFARMMNTARLDSPGDRVSGRFDSSRETSLGPPPFSEIIGVPADLLLLEMMMTDSTSAAGAGHCGNGGHNVSSLSSSHSFSELPLTPAPAPLVLQPDLPPAESIDMVSLQELSERLLGVLSRASPGDTEAVRSPLSVEWLPDAADSLSGWVKRLADAFEANHQVLEAGGLLLLAADIDHVFAVAPSTASHGRTAATILTDAMLDRAATMYASLRRSRRRCAIASRTLAQLQRRLDETRRLCEQQCEAAAALLLNQQLPILTSKLAPLFITFQSTYPPLAMGQCTCFAPFHHTCSLCTARRDALGRMLDTLDDATLHPYVFTVDGKAATPRSSPLALKRRTSGSGADVDVTMATAASSSVGEPATDETANLLRVHLREIATRQVYHSLFACSADDASVAAHLRSLSTLQPEHLGVKRALAKRELWQAASHQLQAIDGVTTPAAALRCVLRSWDALLGVLGVWSKHAQADDFMPLMAFVIIQAAPTRLISQLHFLRNHLGEMSGRQEMWIAHFTAACEVACRLTATISPESGLAVSTDSSVWHPPPDQLGPARPPGAPATPEAQRLAADARDGIDERKVADSEEGEGRTKAESKVPLKHASPKELKGSLSRRYSYHHRRHSQRERAAADADASSMSRVSSWQTIEPPTTTSSTPVTAPSMQASDGQTLSETHVAAELPEEASSEEMAAMRQAALTMMRDMGFVDEALNQDVLAACGYNAERAISLLLGDEQLDVQADSVTRTPTAMAESSHFRKAVQSMVGGKRHFAL